MSTITLQEGVLEKKKFKDIAELYDYVSEKFLNFRELDLKEVTPDMLKVAQQARNIPKNRLHNL